MQLAVLTILDLHTDEEFWDSNNQFYSEGLNKRKRNNLMENQWKQNGNKARQSSPDIRKEYFA